MKFSTKSIHTGETPNLADNASGDVIIPLHLSTTFARRDLEIPTGGYEYSRSLNPTRKSVETKLAAIENAKYALAFASGLAAETSLLLALLKSGDHVITTDDLYGGTQRLFRKVFQDKYGIEFSFVDTSNVAEIEKAIKPNTVLLWIETPTNPMLKITDIAAASKIAKTNDIYTVVDNTFMSPYFQNPLDLGADIILHSTSKYINGHSDSIGGAIMVNDESLFTDIKFMQNSAGGIMSPFDSYLVLRGIKTLGIRMEQHQKNAMELALYLENHPKVKKVIYPGLNSHPQHKIAKEQASGFGGMISFELKGNLETAKQFLYKLEYFALAESLGGVEGLIELPALMTHGSVPAEDRLKLGISDTLVRMSPGIENTSDLIKDVEQALKNI